MYVRMHSCVCVYVCVCVCACECAQTNTQKIYDILIFSLLFLLWSSCGKQCLTFTQKYSDSFFQHLHLKYGLSDVVRKNGKLLTANYPS